MRYTVCNLPWRDGTPVGETVDLDPDTVRVQDGLRMKRLVPAPPEIDTTDPAPPAADAAPVADADALAAPAEVPEPAPVPAVKAKAAPAKPAAAKAELPPRSPRSGGRKR